MKHRLQQPIFPACLDNPAISALVNSNSIRITGTPTFLAARWDHRTDTANGETITGAVDADTLSTAPTKALDLE